MNRTHKHSAAACLRFKQVVTDYITSRGAVEDDWYGFTIDTPAGALNIAVHDNWIETRFNDLAKGIVFTDSINNPCNPCTGKWNFHFENLNPDFVLQHFVIYLEKLLAWESVAAQ